MRKQTQENIHVNALESQAYNPVLTVSSTNEVITVTAEPPQLETSNATLGATMEQETYAELPIEMGAYGQADQRRATDFVYLMPGVQGNETNGNATTNMGVVNGSGSRGAASAVYIDGLPFVRAAGNGDPRYVWTAISVDAVDQFQVQTTGYSAIYEGQGVMNYSVKQGGSQQHGSVYEFFRNTALDTLGILQGLRSRQHHSTAEAGRAQQRVRHQPRRSADSVRWPEGQALLLHQLQRFPLQPAQPDADAVPDQCGTGRRLQRGLVAAISTIRSRRPHARRTAPTVPAGISMATGPGIGTGPAGNPVADRRSGRRDSVHEFSTVAKNLQAALPSIPSAPALGNNYTAPNFTGLINWSTTSRIDYVMNSRDTISRSGRGRPSGQFGSGRADDLGPQRGTGSVQLRPVLRSQDQGLYGGRDARLFAESAEPVEVWLCLLLQQDRQSRRFAEVFSNDDGPDRDCRRDRRQMSSRSSPSPAADAPTNWGGTNENTATALNYTLLDNVQWNIGKHSFTFGGQIAWLLYNNLQAKGGSTPLTLANAVTETRESTPPATLRRSMLRPPARACLCQLPGGRNRQGQLTHVFAD